MKRLLVLFLAVACTAARAEEGGKPLRILTVGNSFAYNATKFLPQLAGAAGRRVEIGSANFRGCSLELHWTTAQAAETGRPEGAIYPPKTKGGPRRTLRDFLEAGPWDVVTIQQASALSDDVATYRPFAKDLLGYIRLHAPGAEVLFHQTWAYRNDDPRFRDGMTAARMHEGIRRACHEVAGELGLRIAPVGDAFAIAGAKPEWTFRADPDFDPSSLKHPDVPPEPGSLHAGWTWFDKPEGWKFALDAHHANLFGQYLGSCVFFEILFGRSVVGNPFAQPGITPEQALSLQKSAHQAVIDLTTATHP